MAELLECGAEFSPDRLHRYRLWRVWSWALPRLTFVGLNPSTADDATLRKLSTLTLRLGYGRLEVVNAYSRIETDSRKLKQHVLDLDRDEAWAHFHDATHDEDTDVALGWGRQVPRERVLLLRERLPGPLLCFGYNYDGSPKHPLYLPHSSTLRPWVWRG